MRKIFLAMLRVIVLVMVLLDVSCRKGNPITDEGEYSYWLAYDDGVQIYFMRDDGTGNKMLMTSDSLRYEHFYPLLSPDGRMLSMVRKKIGFGGWQIAILNLSTKEIKVLFEFPTDTWIISNGSWSATSKYYAFMGPEWGWRITSVDGGTNMALDPGSAATSLAWCPVDDKMVYSVAYAETDSFATFIYDVATGVKKQISDSLANGNWSPDGKKILLYGPLRHLSDTNWPLYNIYEYSIDGETYRQLTFNNESRLGYYSPDGKKIAYISGPADWNAMNLLTLHVMNLSDGANRMVASASGPDRYICTQGFCWSQDNKKICFSMGGSGYHEDIYIVNGDGTGLHLLKENAHNPSWGPKINDFTPF